VLLWIETQNFPLINIRNVLGFFILEEWDRIAGVLLPNWKPEEVEPKLPIGILQNFRQCNIPYIRKSPFGPNPSSGECQNELVDWRPGFPSP